VRHRGGNFIERVRGRIVGASVVYSLFGRNDLERAGSKFRWQRAAG
jgi:hypothetical protein